MKGKTMTEKFQMLVSTIKKNPVVWTGIALFVALILVAFVTIQIFTLAIPSKSALGMIILTVYALTVFGCVCIPEWSQTVVKNYIKK